MWKHVDIMKFLIFTAFLALTKASTHIIPLGVTVGITPHSHAIQSLYHAQDVLGQYAYGYATPTSTKTETKTADGVTKGGYSYIDTNGLLQTVEYVADPLNGFRVAATNLPQDLPDVAHARAQHLAEYQAVKNEREQIAAQVVQYSNPVAVPASAVPQVPLVALPQPVQDLPEVVKARQEHLAALHQATISGGVLPQPVQDLPEVVRARAEHLAAVEATKVRDAIWNNGISLSPLPAQLTGASIPVQTSAVVTTTQQVPGNAPVAPALITYKPAVLVAAVRGQYLAQDHLGQYSYGYVGPLSSKQETRTADGITRGGYSYIDANGIIQTVQYISDPVNGFRVAATNLPTPPVVNVVPPHVEHTIVEGAAQKVVAEQVAPVVPAQVNHAVVGQKVIAAQASPTIYHTDIVY